MTSEAYDLLLNGSVNESAAQALNASMGFWWVLIALFAFIIALYLLSRDFIIPAVFGLLASSFVIYNGWLPVGGQAVIYVIMVVLFALMLMRFFMR